MSEELETVENTLIDPNVLDRWEEQDYKDIKRLRSKYVTTARDAEGRLRKNLENYNYRITVLGFDKGKFTSDEDRQIDEQISRLREHVSLIDTYLQSAGKTSANAIAALESIRLTSSYSMDEVKLRFLVDKIIPERRLTMSYGESGSGKTFIALEKCLSIITGLEFLGKHKVLETGACWYIVADRQTYEVIERYKNACKAYEIDEEQHPLYIANYFDLDIDLLDKRDINKFVQMIYLADKPPIYIVIDSLYGVSKNLTMQDTRMGKLLSNLNYIIDKTGITIDVIHHETVSTGKEAGTTFVRAPVDFKYRQQFKEDNLLAITLDLANSRKAGETFYVECFWEDDGCHQFEITGRTPKTELAKKTADGKEVMRKSKTDIAEDFILEHVEELLGKSIIQAAKYVAGNVNAGRDISKEVIEKLIDNHIYCNESGEYEREQGKPFMLCKGENYQSDLTESLTA